jgi:nicotinamidase-related amidase
MSDWKFDGKPGLVLLHLQNGLVGEQDFIPNWAAESVRAIRESGMLDRIQDLLAAFRAKKLPVCFVSVNPPGDMPVVPAYGHLFREMEAAGISGDILHDERLRRSMDIIPEMNRQPDEPVLKQWLLGGFTMSGLDLWLKLNYVRTVVLAGYAGHSVVYNTMIQAADLWYSVIIARDATAVNVPHATMAAGTDFAAVDKNVEHVCFDIMAPTYSLVTNAKDIIGHL